MNPYRILRLALMALLTLRLAAPAFAGEASVREDYNEIKAKFKERISKSSDAKAEHKRIYADYADELNKLGSKNRGDTADIALIESARAYKQANDVKSAEDAIKAASKRVEKWENKLYLLQASYDAPNQMALCRDLAKGFLPEAKKDPRKAKDIIPYLQIFDMKSEAEDLAKAVPAKPKRTAPGANDEGLQVRGGGGGGGGAKAIDFSGTDRVSGRKISLGKLKGKVVLLDFWATWCGPCVGELPNVKKLYKEFKGPDFELVGISLDNDLSALDSFVKSEKMDWPQLADGKGWKSDIGRRYGVNSIPHTVLIDREGNVISVDLRGPQLHKAVKSAIDSK